MIERKAGRNRRELGSRYERRTAEYLTGRGFQILAQNYRCRMGEIDVIAAGEGMLIFVEVKYRAGLSFGYSEEAVNAGKQRTIRRVAEFFLITHPEFGGWDCRFDVAAYGADDELTYYENAFGGM